MKNIKYLCLVLLITASFLTGCERELETEGISRITYYAEFQMQGEQWISLPVGASFTDPGVTATEGGQPIQVTVSGDAVNTSTPGVYTIVYTATNKDGFSATTRRYIGVIAQDAIATDLTGSYKRNAGVGGVSNVTKIKDGLYFASNVGGTATSDAIGVYFYHVTGNQLGVPVQVTETGGVFYCDNATVEVGKNYKWVVHGPGYGTALRTFEKI
jgi:hypothetical protein